jgi:uncharacterized membrane protein
VQPIVQATCVPCHSPGGQYPALDFTTYAGLDHDESTAFSQVLTCKMPPSNAPSPLSDADRQVLLAWFVCGAPDG